MAKNARVDAYLRQMAQRRMIGAALLVGAIVSYAGGYVFSRSGDVILEKQARSSDFKLQKATGLKDRQGPLPDSYLGGVKYDIETKRKGQVLYIELEQAASRTQQRQTTRSITVELLETGVDPKNQAKGKGEKSVYSFMAKEPMEFDGSSVDNATFAFHMTVKDPKQYGLMVRVADSAAVWGTLNVQVKTVTASALPFYWGGGLMFVIGLVFTWLGRV